MSQVQKKPPSAEERKRLQREQERQRETAEAARKAREAQALAKELTQAAAACGDPDERQKLLNQALEKEVEAETFGKTAKYLNTGAFQGLCAGAGLGGGVGVALGTLTGTLVGGTTGVITGGIGGGLGLGIGAAHGPWFSVGSLMGNTIRKITGDLPGWKATEEQKAALERMVNGVKDQKRPAEDELVKLSEGGEELVAGKGYTGEREADEGEKGLLQGGSFSMPYVPGITSKKKVEERKAKSKVEQQDPQPSGPAAQQTAQRMEEQYGQFEGEGVTAEETNPAKASPSPARKRPNKIDRTSSQATSSPRTRPAASEPKAVSRPANPSRSNTQTSGTGAKPQSVTQRPPNVQRKSSQAHQSQPRPVRTDSARGNVQQSKQQTNNAKKKPRKLEVRSAAS